MKLERSIAQNPKTSLTNTIAQGEVMNASAGGDVERHEHLERPQMMNS